MSISSISMNTVLAAVTIELSMVLAKQPSPSVFVSYESEALRVR